MLLSVHGFNVSLFLDYSFTFPSLLVSLSFVFSNSSALRHHHRITPRREVATYFLMNCVLESLNHIRMAVNYICFKIACEHESFANSLSMSDSKSPLIFLFNLSNLVSHQDTSQSLIWPSQIIWSSLISGRQVAWRLPIWCGWFSLSSVGCMLLDVWHQVGLSQNCLPPRSLPISCWFVESRATEPKSFLFCTL